MKFTQVFTTLIFLFLTVNAFSQTLPSVADSVSYSLDTTSRQLYATYYYFDTTNQETITRTVKVKDTEEQAKIIGSAYNQSIRNANNNALIVKKEIEGLAKGIQQARDYEKKFGVPVLDTTGIAMFAGQRFKFIGFEYESIRFRLHTPKSKNGEVELPRFQYSFDGELWSKADYLGGMIKLHNVKFSNTTVDVLLIGEVQEKRVVFEDMNGWVKMIVR